METFVMKTPMMALAVILMMSGAASAYTRLDVDPTAIDRLHPNALTAAGLRVDTTPPDAIRGDGEAPIGMNESTYGKKTKIR